MTTQSDARARLHAMFNLSEADEAELDARIDAVIAAETAAPQTATEGPAPAYRSSILPPRDALCSCGHTGLDHHHAETRCWAKSPRTVQLNRTWSAVVVCDCPKFEAAS
jgi:hypothetical protein